MANENQRKPNDFTPVVSAMELTEYVFEITDNLKKFPDYSVLERQVGDKTIALIVFNQDSLTNIVREETRNIYHFVSSANRINVNRNPDRKAERLELQRKAIETCEDLLEDIQICRKHFHLSSKRIKYWGGKVRDLKLAIEKWHENDKGRYGNITV